MQFNTWAKLAARKNPRLNIRSICGPSLPIWWRHNLFDHSAVRYYYTEHRVNPYWLLIRTHLEWIHLPLILDTEILRKLHVATHLNVEYISRATSFSSIMTLLADALIKTVYMRYHYCYLIPNFTFVSSSTLLIVNFWFFTDLEKNYFFQLWNVHYLAWK